MVRAIIRILALPIVLTLACGCAALDLNLPGSRSAANHDGTDQVTHIVCLWDAAEGVGLDGLPSRGFAGQILFFAYGQDEPVRVNGDVRIYVFDDQGSIEEQSRPLHQFDFPAAAWNTYLQQTNLGPAYQLFIPYTRKGGHAAECALRVRFTAEGRTPVYSKMATIALPGRREADSPSTPTETSPSAARNAPVRPEDLAIIQQMAYQHEQPDFSAQLKRLRTAAELAVHADATADAPAHPLNAPQPDSDAPASRRYRIQSARSAE